MQEQLKSWFESHRRRLIERFLEAGDDAEHLPGFAKLKPRHLFAPEMPEKLRWRAIEPMKV